MTDLLTLSGAIALGTFTFWAFWATTVIGSLILIGLTQKEHYGWATGLFALFFTGCAVGGIFNLYTFAITEPLTLGLYIASYIGVAAIWGAVKWWRYCIEQRKLYETAKTDFLKSKKATELTADLRVEWTELLRKQDRYTRYYVQYADIPSAASHKEKIMVWMYLWPFSMIGTVCSDFLIRVWDGIYEWMTGIYDSIAASVWKGTESDLASEEDIAQAKAARDVFEVAAAEQRQRDLYNGVGDGYVYGSGKGKRA